MQIFLFWIINRYCTSRNQAGLSFKVVSFTNSIQRFHAASTRLYTLVEVKSIKKKKEQLASSLNQVFLVQHTSKYSIPQNTKCAEQITVYADCLNPLFVVVALRTAKQHREIKRT